MVFCFQNGQDRELFSEKDGLPRKAFPNGWKGENGLYSVGFTRRGLMGTSVDAKRIAYDIEQHWKAKGTRPDVFLWPSSLLFAIDNRSRVNIFSGRFGESDTR